MTVTVWYILILHPRRKWNMFASSMVLHCV